MQLFYSSDIQGDILYLDSEESRHALQVLRKQVGDDIHVMDGKGKLYFARITEASKKSAKLNILSFEEFEKREAYFHLAIAPTKNLDRIEWLIEKAIEIGIEEISFLECFHSERRVLKMERLEKIILSAAKQSKSWHFPKMNALVKFKDFIKNETACVNYIATCDGQEKQWGIGEMAPIKSLVMVGPEGDFSEDEISLAKSSGYTSLALGTKRLRTETAGLQACSWFNLFHS